jgi:hypothetical protein
MSNYVTSFFVNKPSMRQNDSFRFPIENAIHLTASDVAIPHHDSLEISRARGVVAHRFGHEFRDGRRVHGKIQERVSADQRIGTRIEKNDLIFPAR